MVLLKRKCNTKQKRWKGSQIVTVVAPGDLNSILSWLPVESYLYSRVVCHDGSSVLNKEKHRLDERQEVNLLIEQDIFFPCASDSSSLK